MIILTGGAGFIGSAFLSKLNQAGHKDIIVVDNLGKTEKWKNLVGKTYTDYVHKEQFLELILEDSLPEVPSAIVHMGACSSTTEENAEYMMFNNYYYSKVLAEYALENNVRFIYASSAAVYGDGNLGFSDSEELSAQLKPLNVYGYSKLAFDNWAIENNLTDKIAGLRFFNVYGPNEYHKGDMSSVIFKAVKQISETGRLKLFKSYNPEYSDGGQVRDFVYVKDCVEVLYWLLENESANGIFNLGSGKSRSWNDLGNAVFSAMDKESNIEYIEMPETLREKYQYFTEADITKLEETGCPIEQTSLESGVKDYVCNYLHPALNQL